MNSVPVQGSWLADLILLEANPLKDVSVIRKPVGVMVRGKWFSRAELQEELVALAKKFATTSS